MILFPDLSLVAIRNAAAAGGLTGFFQDTFDEAMATELSAHTPDEGTGWIITKYGGYTGDLIVAGSNAQTMSPDTTANNDGVLATANVNGGYPSANYSLRATHVGASTLTQSWGFAMRIQDTTNYYTVPIYDEAGAGGVTVGIFKIEAGTPTVLDTTTDTGIDPALEHEWRVEIDGSTISVYIDDVLHSSATDATDPYATGLGGLAFGTALDHTNDDMVTTHVLSLFHIVDLG